MDKDISELSFRRRKDNENWLKRIWSEATSHFQRYITCAFWKEILKIACREHNRIFSRWKIFRIIFKTMSIFRKENTAIQTLDMEILIVKCDLKLYAEFQCHIWGKWCEIWWIILSDL